MLNGCDIIHAVDDFVIILSLLGCLYLNCCSKDFYRLIFILYLKLSVFQEKYFLLGRAFLKQCYRFDSCMKMGSEIGSHCADRLTSGG